MLSGRLMSTIGRAGPRSLVLVVALALAASNLAAQSLTSGALKGTFRSADGRPLRGVNLTLESKAGATILTLDTGFDGEFRVSSLHPAEYRLLAELQGYQPVRVTPLMVTAGETTVVDAVLERKPPPILAVQEITGSVKRVGSANGRTIDAREFDLFDYRRDAVDALRGSTEVVWPMDGRSGLGLAAAGLPGSRSRMIVDGVVESQVRHLGLPSEPLSYSAQSRDGLAQARILTAPLDAEWRGTVGSVFAAQSRSGGDRVVFSPFVSGSAAKLGGRAVDNPLDSAATSFQVGAVLSGAVSHDTANFLLRFDYRSLEIPTANPWEHDEAQYRGAAVSLRETLSSIAVDSFAATAIGSQFVPAVRTWKGATGMGKVNWMLSPTSRVAARLSFADWRERTPYLGEGVSLAAGSGLKGRDVSAAIGISTAGTKFANELRAGLSAGRRDFTAGPIAETALVTDGVAFGGSSAEPAFFDVRTLDLSNAFQFSKGNHQLKAGVSLTSTAYQHDYRFGGGGIFRFADLDQFGAAQGSFYQAVGTEIARFSGTDLGAFFQDSWLAAPDVQVLLGLRYDVSFVPKSKPSFNAPWFQASGIRNDSLKTSKKGISPRIGFVWDVKDWIVRGGVGVQYGSLDPTTYGEAMLYDGGVTIRRGTGTFASWPLAPDAALVPTIGPALTILNRTLRPPRALKAELGFTRLLPRGYSLHLTGGYYHTDFLLRRTDLNRPIDPIGTSQEGRPVFGLLRKVGGFVSPIPGSNRRFSDFDMVSGLSPVGFADHYEVTASLERRLSEALSLAASYTFSRTTDNMVGSRSADPADQLSPFPGGLNGVDWDRGTSDFDVPHRFAATAEYRSRGANPVTVGARYRIRSGLPFTAGFRQGVDLNADGAGGNDPVSLGSGLTGLTEVLAAGGCPSGLGGQFVERNGCREKMHQGLDLRLAVGLPFSPKGRPVFLEVNAFNVVATATGVVDRAALLIAPTGALTTDGAGNVTLPLTVNSRFGSLLARRGEPRVVRIGLRMDY